ncbi:hypothetical protein SBRCBS47491_004594 [Sporothrix bragantina]|uniref:Zn(2)-C6 fungal-type domain-containing protein n=1 Tax=Sporothrix bragantina TaxID=671064 RepID=A0ABP0BRE7_9PEZI
MQQGNKATRGARGTRTARATKATAGAAVALTALSAGTTLTTQGTLMATQTATPKTESTTPSNMPNMADTTTTASGAAASKVTPRQDASPASSTATATAGGAATSAVANTTTTAAPAKRQRVSRACDQCRAMREKCDGAQPQCSSCVTQRRTCSYKTSPKKRGVQTGYIRTLELTLSSLLDEVPGCAEAIDTMFGGEAATRLFHPEATGNQQKDLDRHNRLHRRWHKSRARKEINRLLSTEGFGGGPARPLSDRASDDDEDSGGGPTSGGGPVGARQGGVSTWSPDNTIPSPLSGTGTGLDEAGSRLPLPPHHWRLLDVYFSYTHCWFPILERQDVLKTVYQHEREMNEPTSAPSSNTTSSAAMAELWSVLALASFQDAASRRQQQQQDTQRTSSSHPSTIPPSSTSSTTLDPPPWPPHRIYHVARQMIPLDDGPFEIQHARAVLLLALVNIGRRRYTAARVLIALSLQIAEDAGYDQRLPQTRRIVDAVTSGGCLLDAFLGVVRTSLGRRRTGPSSAPHACPGLPEDGLDEWQPWVPCSGFALDDGAPFDRSPAYSLTTFNQLHALFNFMQGDPRQSSSPSDYKDIIAAAAGGHNLDMDGLERVMRPDVPFASFARSNDRAPRAVSAVPSAYVLRITFVWMRLLVAQRQGGNGADQAQLLADVLDQFLVRFGAAGAPPTLVPCITTVVEHPSFRTLSPPLQQQLCAIGDMLEAVWHVQEQQQSAARTNAVLRQKLMAVPPQSIQSTSVAAPSANAMNPTPVVYHSASPESVAGMHQQQQQQQRPQTAARHHRMSFLEAQPPPPPIPPQHQQQGPTSNMYSSGGHAGHASHAAPGPAYGFHPLPISPQTAGGEHQPQQAAYPHMMGTSYVGVTGATGAGTEMAVDLAGSNTLDYDALLDDLSAVDYLDRLDTDIGSQFMANLGFAPGSDNLHMMGEFGGL